MSSPLVARTAMLCRSAIAKPALLNTVRFSSSQTKDVIHLENEPTLSVENLSGAPGKNIKEKKTTPKNENVESIHDLTIESFYRGIIGT